MAAMAIIRDPTTHDRQKKSEFVSVRTSEATKNELLAIAKEQERPLGWVVNKVLERYLQERRKTQGE